MNAPGAKEAIREFLVISDFLAQQCCFSGEIKPRRSRTLGNLDQSSGDGMNNKWVSRNPSTTLPASESRKASLFRKTGSDGVPKSIITISVQKVKHFCSCFIGSHQFSQGRERCETSQSPLCL